MSTTVADQGPVRTSTRLCGTTVERHGWLLVALLQAVIVLVGAQTILGGDSRSEAISGSGCCNGQVFTHAPQWTFDYLVEAFRYMGSYELGTGIFGLAVTISALRLGRRWAWGLSWLVPLTFAFHAFVLGAFPFDAITMSITALGLLLMVRPVFGTPPQGE